jgi:RNA polymerase sigma-54 factor
MAMSPRLELRQGQSLVMTPQLQQAIKLLQLSNLELTAFVQQELERNPLLEQGQEPPADPGDRTEDRERVLDGPDGPADMLGDVRAADATAPVAPQFEPADVTDSQADRVNGEPMGAGLSMNGPVGAGGSLRFDDGEYGLEQTLSAELTLKDHLISQMQVDLHDPVELAIGRQLVEMLDDAGYIDATDLAEAAERLGAEPAKIEAVLEKVQHLDPPGVFARNLAECLALQLRELDRLDPAMQALLENLDFLARRELDRLCALCGVDHEDLADMISEIRALNPKPGLVFDTTPVQPVVPDVFVRPNSTGGWHVELNADTLPRVLVNTRYYARVTGSARSKDDKAFLSECLTTANWLVKSLDQRAKTILKVASEIVRQQDSFLVNGVHHLRPLNLRAIAEAIEMHESTVSRVTANKYMATPRGIFEMKYFFTAAIQAVDGEEAHSAEAVRHRIKELIDQERPEDVLSDDKLVEVLRTSGIDIARRTIAKYREALNIPSSVQRRREKRLSA